MPAAEKRWGERLGLYGTSATDPCPIWIHAVSLGESLAVVPLVERLLVHCADQRIVFTTTTRTGAAAARRALGERVRHAFFPYDIPSAINRFRRRFEPRLLILVETELWPNLTSEMRAGDIPVVLVNARLSPGSMRGYLAFSSLSRSMVGSLSLILAQSDADAARFISLGAPQDCVSVSGNLKFDAVAARGADETMRAARLRSHLGESRRIIAFGSTRQGEELLLLPVFFELLAACPDLLVVLAPRHPQRFDEVYELLLKNGFNIARHSSGNRPDSSTEVYLVDVVGELPQFFALAEIAFVGGSMRPLGGHNVLEPASVGTPVLTGPSTFNFAESCRLLQEAGGLLQVEDTTQLVQQALAWLSDRDSRLRAGHRALAVVKCHEGATERTMKKLLERCPALHASADNN